MPSIEVRCDNSGCGWTKDVDIDEAKEGMKCEKCGSTVINEADMRVLNKMRKLIKLDKVWKSLVPKKFQSNVEVEAETGRREENGIVTTETTIKITDKGRE